MSDNILHPNTMLIVDDSSVSRKIITGIIKDLNFKIDYASSGNKAIEMIAQNDYSCILLDLLMDDGDGFSVLRKMKELNSKIPVIVVSADIQETTKEKCLELGAIGIVNKPPTKNDLMSNLYKALLITGDM